MILVDFHSIVIANISYTFFKNENVILDEDIVRNMILRSLRAIKRRFPEYGKMIISCDGKNYWRKKIFPYYKLGRKKDKDESIVNWDEIHSYMDKIKEELHDYMPYQVIEINEAESDDIIGTICQLNFHLMDTEKILIISRDKDFMQLQIYPNVKQFDWIGDKYLVCDDPKRFLFDHICKGDSGDGIPNVVSLENSLAIGLRQKPMTQKKMDAWYVDDIPEEIKPRFELNKKLIDLTCIPEDINKQIQLTNWRLLTKSKKRVMEYFMKYGLKEQITNYQDF